MNRIISKQFIVLRIITPTSKKTIYRINKEIRLKLLLARICVDQNLRVQDWMFINESTGKRINPVLSCVTQGIADKDFIIMLQNATSG